MAADTGATAAADERTVRLARKRFARRQWARRWLAWRGLLVLLALLVLGGAAAWLVFFSSALAVQGVDVEGIEVLDRAEVRRAAAVPSGEPLARVPLADIEDRIEQLAPVQSVDVSRAWPDRVRIAVTEREAVAVVDQDGVLRGVDEEGVLFRSFPSQPKGLPVIRIPDGTRSEALAEAALVIAALPDDLAGRVAHLSVATVDSISLQMRNGKQVVWGSAADSVTKAEVLAVLLRQQASVYDVSVPGQPTIKP